MQHLTFSGSLKVYFLAISLLFSVSGSFNARADWLANGNTYECRSGNCSITCTGANECEGKTFIASHGAVEASVTCIGVNSCLDAVFYLAARNNNTLACGGTDSCKNAAINVGVPDSVANPAPVPPSFSQSDFFGLINSFTLSCSVDLACTDTTLVSYYEISNQDIYCAGDTDACDGLDVEASSTIGDVSIVCQTIDSCNAVAFTTAAPTAGCNGDFCASVTHTEYPAPTPDVDGDGVLDVNDLCPTGASVITDLDPVDGCDDGVENPDADNDGVPDVVDGNTLEWSGPTFLGDFFDEGNWEDNGLATAADVVNPDKVIGREILLTNTYLIIENNTNIFLGEGNSLTLNGGTLGASTNTNFYPVSTLGSGNAFVTIKGNANFNFGLAWGITWRIEGTSRLTTANTDFSSDTGVFGKSSTVDFIGGTTRVILSAINVNDAETMLAKFKVDGNAAVLDTNIIIKQSGEFGSIVLPDFDSDGKGGPDDACPKTVSMVSDLDDDGCDDASEDNDDDNDGVADEFDSCFTSDFSLSADFDGDGCDDANEDTDDDNDGKLDTGDMCLTADATLSIDVDGDGCDDEDEDTDDDNDGVLDTFDQCITTDFNLSADNDFDGCDDADEDKDDDNDGVPDRKDAFPNDPSKSVEDKSKGGGGSLFYLLGLSGWTLARRRALNPT